MLWIETPEKPKEPPPTEPASPVDSLNRRQLLQQVDDRGRAGAFDVFLLEDRDRQGPLGVDATDRGARDLHPLERLRLLAEYRCGAEAQRAP